MVIRIIIVILLLVISVVELANCQNNSNSNSTEINSGKYFIPIYNGGVQATLMTIILILAVTFNSLVIINVSMDALKREMVHFILIRHVCLTDLFGALGVIPVPLFSVAREKWDYGETACTLLSTSTASLWTMHLLAVSFYRADRVLAVWVPVGSYPIISVRHLHAVLTLCWVTVMSMSGFATWFFGPTFSHSLALCIPNVPLLFFICVFSCYVIGLLVLTSGYCYLFFKRRRKSKLLRRMMIMRNNGISNSTSDSYNNSALEEETQRPLPAHYQQKSSSHFRPALPNYRSAEQFNRLLLSYSVTFGHLLLYLPAILFVGLKKPPINPSIALISSMIVYSEFLIQPIALAALSPRLRTELTRKITTNK